MSEYHEFAILEWRAGLPLVLTPEVLLLSTCLHHSGKDQLRLLKQVSDIAAILQQFGAKLNWEKIQEIGIKWRVFNLILISLSLICPTAVRH